MSRAGYSAASQAGVQGPTVSGTPSAGRAPQKEGGQPPPPCWSRGHAGATRGQAPLPALGAQGAEARATPHLGPAGSSPRPRLRSSARPGLAGASQPAPLCTLSSRLR